MSAAISLTRRNLGNLLGLALAAAGLAATVIRIFRPYNLQQDFAYIYVAGRTWIGGFNPYTADYALVSRSLFYNGNWPTDWFFPPELWVYPPQWSAIAMPVALMSFHDAALLWQLIVGLSIVASVLILGTCADSLKHPPSRLLKGLFAFLLMTGEASNWNIWLGQTGSVVLLGFALALYGIAYRSRPLLAVGFWLLLLKPQIGIAFVLIGLCEKEQRIAAVAAVATTLLTCVPAVAATGFSEAPRYITGYLHNLHEYVTSAPNMPQAMTGAGQLLYYFGLKALPGPAYPFIAAALGLIMLHIARPLDRQAYLLRYWAMALVLLGVVVPLHGNDLMALFSILLLLPCMDVAGAICAIICAATLYRPTNVFHFGAPNGQQFYWGARIEGVAAIFLVIALYRALVSPARVPMKTVSPLSESAESRL